MNSCITLLFALFISISVYGQEKWMNELKPLVVEDTSHTMTLQSSMAQHNVHSVAIAFTDKSGNLGTWAYSNQESFEEIPADTRYQAGSISKPVAALGVIVLADKYNLDLDKSINSYLKSWKLTSDNFDASKVTIRNLLSHTAGTTVHGFMGYRKAKKVPEITEILEGEGNSDVVSMFNESDSVWKYSGGGYQILHLLIEDISGDDFAVFLQREVLDPIGMTNSTYEILLEEDCSDCARAFKRNGKAYKPSWYLYPESAAAGLWTTSEDLTKFLQYLAGIYNGSEGIVSSDRVKEMFTPVQQDYGMGFFVTERNEERYVGHSGKNIGFTNDMLINLSTGESFVCLSDSDAAFRTIDDLKRSLPGEGSWEDRPQVVATRVEKSAASLERIAGKYRHKRKGGGTYKAKLLVEEGKVILVNQNAGSRQELIPSGETEYTSSADGTKMEIKEENGQMVLIIGRNLKFTKK